MRSIREHLPELLYLIWHRHFLVPLAAIAMAGVAAGCGSNSETTTASPSAVKCQVALTTGSPSVGPDGGAGTLTVTTTPECPWNVSTSSEWLSGLSPASGQGNGTVEFHVAPNPTPSMREGDLVVNDIRMRVSQQAAPCRFELQPSSFTSPSAGETREVRVSAPGVCAWNVVSDAGWITFTTEARGNGNGTVRLRVAPNGSNEQRTGTIAVGDQRATVTQAGLSTQTPPATGAPCTYDVDGPGSTVPAGGASGLSVSVRTNTGCPWTAVSNVPWITVTSTGAPGDGSVTFSVAANTGALRTGTLTVADRVVTVTQAAVGVSCAYAINPTSSAVAVSGSSGSITVSAGNGCAWTASSNASWLTVTSGASGSGNGSVGYSVAANTGGVRSGTISAAGQTFTVTQAAALQSCTYTINSASTSVVASGGSGSITVSAGNGCAWTASSNAGWLAVTSGASGSGNGSVGYSAAANTAGARSGTISVAGQTFTVSQAAAVQSCSYSINPSSVEVGKNGGNGSVSVSAGSGCTWSASSNAGWLTITTGSSGSGNGAVSFSFEKNRDEDERTGTLTIAGRTFTVRQKD